MKEWYDKKIMIKFVRFGDYGRNSIIYDTDLDQGGQGLGLGLHRCDPVYR